MITMYDSTNVADLPAGGLAYAGYVDGYYRTFPDLLVRFGHAKLLGIAVNPMTIAECLDVEKGNATASQVPGWIRNYALTKRPVIYASRNLIPTILTLIGDLPIRIWSAHYGSKHICAPDSCGASFTADGTQYASPSTGAGGHYDTSILNDNFFTVTPPIVAKGYDVSHLPTLQSGSTGQAVRNLQGLLYAAGRVLSIDGVFGRETATVLATYQTAAGITSDSICGPQTWGTLLGASVAP